MIEGDGDVLRNENRIAEISSMWEEALANWKVPDQLLARAAKSPYRLNPAKFRPDPSRRLSGTVQELERLIHDQPRSPHSLLDVGSASGSLSLLVVDQVDKVIALDQSREMLDAFEENAKELGVFERVTTVHSPWPSPIPLKADIVLSANVLYNVPNPAKFIDALIGAAGQSVVIELTQNHPLSIVNELYQRFHTLDRPTIPTADYIVDLVEAFGYSPRVERWIRSTTNDRITAEERLTEYQSRACIEETRKEELRQYLLEHELPMAEVVMVAFEI
ncbi:MAG: class I SAM-dependent methyltransferase [Actinomycetota bacterium]|nr:class I SAM-dependent methyltransferase [Actinomycetota bacterium]